MASFLRILLVATALLSGGVLQVAAAFGDDACCAGEQGSKEGKHAPCTNCPPGVACACCPIRGTVESAPLVVPPAESSGVAVAVAVSEPIVGPSVTDIFHPPRA
jgi:hypothetical protein